MRRIILATLSTVAGLVLLLSFRTHSTSAVTQPPAAASSPGGTTSGSTRSSGSGSTSTTRTVTGNAAETIYGSVQVKITIRNGKVVAVIAVEYPQSSPHDAQINAYAIPALNKETVAAGSAHIDAISGATYTSDGYVTSLQSALDKAGL